MRVYLDACSLQRPLDDRSQTRVNVEAEAVLAVLGLVESGHIELVSSEALEFEICRMPDTDRQARAEDMMRLACQTQKLTADVEARAVELNRLGIPPMDALHLAFAESSRVDFFCTCDDKLFKKAGKVESLHTVVVTPLQLIGEVAP